MLLSGKNPFPGKSNEVIKRMIRDCNIKMLLKKDTMSHLSKAAKSFLKHCMKRNVDKRYSAE